MQIPSLAQLKKELSYLPEKELIEVILELSKFSRDNKSFLFFKLNEKDNPGLFVEMAGRPVSGISKCPIRSLLLC
jgi:hypothetical protein